jgi:intracellular septation protein
MNQLLEWSPLIVFFAVFKLFGIYWATASLMFVCTLVLLVHRLRTGRFKTMHVVTVVVVLILGAATLSLHDRRFIQWKPTVLLALTAAAFLLSTVVGKQPLARRMFEGVFNEALNISPQAWVFINSLWVGWFALLATANIYVAHNFTESIWVNFKVFGLSAAMLLFLIPQVFWLSGRIKPAPSSPPVVPTARTSGTTPP